MKTRLLVILLLISSVKIFSQFESEQIISTTENEATSVFVADINGDGYLDVLSASWFIDKITWYENTDGQRTFGAQQIIANPNRLLEHNK